MSLPTLQMQRGCFEGREARPREIRRHPRGRVRKDSPPKKGTSSWPSLLGQHEDGVVPHGATRIGYGSFEITNRDRCAPAGIQAPKPKRGGLRG